MAIDKIEHYDLNGNKYLYIKQREKTEQSKTLYKIEEAQSRVRPVISVSRKENGRVYSYHNYSNFDTVFAEKSLVRDTYSVSIPTKKGGTIIGYIKENTPIAWTKDKNALKLLKKIGLIIKNGI